MVNLMDRRIQRNSLNEEGTQRAFVAVKGFVLEVTQCNSTEMSGRSLMPQLLKDF